MTQASFNGDQPVVPSRFRMVRWREGYDTSDVDALVALIDAGTVTRDDIAQARFRPVRLRPGYDMDEVDMYLDRAEKELRASGQ